MLHIYEICVIVCKVITCYTIIDYFYCYALFILEYSMCVIILREIIRLRNQLLDFYDEKGHNSDERKVKN